MNLVAVIARFISDMLLVEEGRQLMCSSIGLPRQPMAKRKF